MFLIMLQACFRICGSYMMYLEGDGSHQTIMILCECIWSSYIITFHIMIYLYSLAKGSHTTCIFFATFDTIVQVQCDLAITRDTCGSIHFLNFLNMFWNKIWLDFFSVFFISECFASRVEVMFLCLICSLNCLNLFWNKIWLDLFSVFWSRNTLHIELRLCFCA